MKTTSKTLLTLAFATTGLAAFAIDTPSLTTVQDAHGSMRVMFLPGEPETMSVALLTHGRAISSNRSQENANADLMAITTSNQHAQPVTHFEQLR